LAASSDLLAFSEIKTTLKPTPIEV
jgi:hypothetical protein